MARRPTSIPLEPQEQRKVGSALFNYTWTLLEKADRTERETDRMIDAAHASRLFWEKVGEPDHARGEWQISRAYATAGQAQNAYDHAERCLAICEASGVEGFDLACAYEALARACALAGDSDGVALYSDKARDVANSIVETADRKLVLDDLAAITT